MDGAIGIGVRVLADESQPFYYGNYFFFPAVAAFMNFHYQVTALCQGLMMRLEKNLKLCSFYIDLANIDDFVLEIGFAEVVER